MDMCNETKKGTNGWNRVYMVLATIIGLFQTNYT